MFGVGMVNPWLLAAGATLVASPIIIHLLNKRRFRVVDWAAMDFLIEADQRNRRRVRLEDLLLLALRCLAVLLMGLLVARPYLPSALTRGWFQSVRTERIVLLDDSPSMEASEPAGSPFRQARERLSEFVTALADRTSGDTLTLLLTSRPARPVLADVAVNERSAPELLREIEGLQVSDLASRLPEACAEIRSRIGQRSDKINRAVYLLTDLRQRDWTGPVERSTDVRPSGARSFEESTGEDAVIGALRSLAAESTSCFVVDFGDVVSDNVAVESIVPDNALLLAGSDTRFNVTVRNYGSHAVHGVPVRFIAAGSLPLTARLDSVPAGGTAAVPFSYALAPEIPGEAGPPPPLEFTADLGTGVAADALASDNSACFAARVRRGIPTLIVDGDPSTEFGRSESFFLQRALAPPGQIGSGVLLDVVSDSEFQDRSLDAYQVVYLCNVYHVSEGRRQTLQDWVSQGGGLVIWPGGQVDSRNYAEQFGHDGQGLLPRGLERIAGDETEKTWVGFHIEAPAHPIVRVFAGDAAPLLQSNKIFQWWQVSPVSSQGSAPSTTILTLTDPERSPALIERPHGSGRVVQINVAADSDWSNWPQDASYLILLQELNRYLAQTIQDAGQLRTGESIVEPLDIARELSEVQIVRPDGSVLTRQAAVLPGPGSDQRERWGVRYDETDVRGFYRISRTIRDSGAAVTLFAVNPPAAEGDLRRLDRESLRHAWEGSDVHLTYGADLASLAADDARGELWLSVLFVLGGVYFMEQLLAWQFGRRR